METFVLWISFIGAWLLFAGPICQAALELKEQYFEEERIKITGAKIQKSPKPSVWWWLFPPVKLYLEQKRSDEYRHKYLHELHPEDAEAVISFINKAIAWAFVAVGGFCIAIKETYELCINHNWNNLIMVGIVAVMLVLSVLNVRTRLKRFNEIPTSS